MNQSQWRYLVGEKKEGARQAGSWPCCKTMEIHAAKKIYATNLRKDVTEAVSQGKEWPEMLPQEELSLLQVSKVMRLREMAVRRAIKEDDFSELMKSVEVNPWMVAKRELLPREVVG